MLNIGKFLLVIRDYELNFCKCMLIIRGFLLDTLKIVSVNCTNVKNIQY